MKSLDEDFDDSAIFCKSLIQKRKAAGNSNPRGSKQLKLTFSQSTSKASQSNEEKKTETDNSEICSAKTSAKLNESQSSYFTNKNSSSACPLCLKSFKTDSAYSGHMKQCAKTHKMTTQQLLAALELQKKQMQERRDLGLCSQKISLPKKKKKENQAEQYDLALGLALSKSLATADPTKISQPEIPQSTLKEFGFTTSGATAGPSRRRNEIDKKSVLRERTVEDRQKIIVEKVAVVLLEENQTSEPENLNSNLVCQSNQIPQLWSMGESNENHGWYVDDIRTLVLSGDDPPPRESPKPTLSDNIDRELSQLNLPRSDIHKDWKKVINNSKLSDLTVKTKDSEVINLHTLVMFARCPEMLEKDCGAVFEKFLASTVTVFLEYLYCGTLNGLTRLQVDLLFDLASEFNYEELVNVLNCLKNTLSVAELSNSSPKLENIQDEIKPQETSVMENEKSELFEGRDLFAEDFIHLTENDQKSTRADNEEDFSENESNAEKSYWSFIQHEKKKQQAKQSEEEKENFIATANDKIENRTNEPNRTQLQRIVSDDSTTRDLDLQFQKPDPDSSSDCIILSSGSDTTSQQQGNLPNPQPSRTPSPIQMDCEVPHFDPYDNFHCFSEEQFSPVGVHSQSLITGDISTESVKLPDVAQENERPLNDSWKEEPKRPIGYSSTPVTVRRPSTTQSSGKNSTGTGKKRRKCDLTASRILRKSLGLHQKSRHSFKKRKSPATKNFAQAVTNTILQELSKSSIFQPSTPSRGKKMFVEFTPVSNRDEFVDDATPSPNYSNMGESLLKEQLTKYGLKRNLAKSKAKKILRHIYEELHPLYNLETGKIVKKLRSDTPKQTKKSKTKGAPRKNAKSKKTDVTEGTKPGKPKNHCNSSKESDEVFERSLDGLTDVDSADSDFENLSETLTQSVPSNPVDLPSAFCDFLQSNPEYHEKILLYEPIWIEDLQKKLKEVYKKHFKMADLMDFLDQKCVTFRSQVQARNLQRRNERRKEKLKRRKNQST